MTKRNGPRGWIGVAAVAALTTGAVVGVAAPSDAATKQAATSVSVAAITHRVTEVYTGDDSVVVSGDKADVTGTASSNLVGKRVTAQIRVKVGTRWTWRSLGSGTVGTTKAYSIRITPTGLGSTTFRVRYAGSTSLASSSRTDTITLSKWFPLTGLTSFAKQESVKGNAPHVVTHLQVVGHTYAKALVGTSLGATAASADFWVDGRCSQAASTVGLASGSPKGSVGTFTTSVDGVEHGSQTVTSGESFLVDGIGLAGAKVLRLENSATVPAGSTPSTAVAGWPNAEVLCTSTPKPRSTR